MLSVSIDIALGLVALAVAWGIALYNGLVSKRIDCDNGWSQIDVQLTITEASCSGNCDGAANIVVSGGTPGYTIVWAPEG